MSLPLDTASLLWWSNAALIVGLGLTLVASILVLLDKRKAGKGIKVKHSVRNEVFLFASALVCGIGTCGTIYFGTVPQRTIHDPKQAAESLKQFNDVVVLVDSNGLNQEALKLRQQLEDIFAEAHVNYKPTVWFGSSATSGDPDIQILHKDELRANQFGDALEAIFKANHIASRQGPPDPRDDSSPIAMNALDPAGLPFVWVHVGVMKRRQ